MPNQSPQLSLATHLQSTRAPWTSLLVLKSGQHVESLVKIPQGFGSKVLRGSKCCTTAGLFSEFERVLNFPDYFGHNWDALEECLADLEWFPAKGYVLIITDAEQVLSGDEDEYETFLEVLSDTGEAWGSGRAGMETNHPIPFHVVLAVSEGGKHKRSHWGVQEIGTDHGDPSGKRRGSSGPNPSRRRTR